jgi:hypothetical protein
MVHGRSESRTDVKMVMDLKGLLIPLASKRLT